MSTTQSALILVLIDLFALWLGVTLQSQNEKRGRTSFVSFIELSLSFLLCLGAHLVTTYGLRLTMDMEDPYDPYYFVIGSGASGFLPLLYFVSMFVKIFLNAATDSMLNSGTGTRIESDFSRAQTLVRAGDVEGAVKQCWDYFAEYPESPRPLFEAQRILHMEHRVHEEIAILREIRRLFEHEDETWVRATVQLANLHENELKDRGTSDLLLQQAIHRSPDSPHARNARGRLSRKWEKQSPLLEANKDPHR